jgi:glycerol-3-phosphate dehydrogenase (NAD(P)+)
VSSGNTIAVLGAGSWGTALAILLGLNGHQVRLWGHLPEEVEALSRDRENKTFLPGIPLPETIRPEADLARALAGVDEVLIVVPSHAFRAVAGRIADLLDELPGVTGLPRALSPAASACSPR